MRSGLGPTAKPRISFSAPQRSQRLGSFSGSALQPPSLCRLASSVLGRMIRVVGRLAGLAAPVAVFGLACVLLGSVGVPSAAAQVQPYGTDNYCCFHDILPPGTNGFDDLAQALTFRATGARPAHNDDQLQMYANLTTAAGSVTQQTIPDYYKDATFGVPAGDVESSESPEPGVTIVRDKQFGVPHIYGDTRAELMFGIGYATAEDRLFFIDALRHAGQGELAQFAGGA